MPDLGETSWAFTTLARKRRWGGHLDLVVIPPKTTWLGLLHSANLVSPTELEAFLSDRNSLHQDLHPCKYLLHWTAPLHWMLPFLVRRPHKQVEMFRIWNTQIQSCFVYKTSRHWVDHSYDGLRRFHFWRNTGHASISKDLRDKPLFHSLFFSAAFSTLFASCTHQGRSTRWKRQTKQLLWPVHWSSNKSVVLLEKNEAACLEIQLSEPSIQWKLILMITWDLTYKWNPHSRGVDGQHDPVMTGKYT